MYWKRWRISGEWGCMVVRIVFGNIKLIKGKDMKTTKTIIIKKGDVSSRIQILKGLTDEVKECFETKEVAKTSMFLPTPSISTAKKSYKFTLTVEEVDDEMINNEVMLEAFCKENHGRFNFTRAEEARPLINSFLKGYKK